MKTSDRILCGLAAVLLTATAGVDVILKQGYAAVRLDDPDRAYLKMDVRPFKHLRITGGNGYAVEIRQAKEYEIKVMRSRERFFSSVRRGDTLTIQFTVASTSANPDPGQLPRGLVISAPRLVSISAEGTSNLIREWSSDSLQIRLEGNATANISRINLAGLAVAGSQKARINFDSANTVKNLRLDLNHAASVYLNQIRFRHLVPALTGDSHIILGSRAASSFFDGGK